MYIIVKTVDTPKIVEIIEGSWPDSYLEELILDKHQDIVVISTYSNTIKVPEIIKMNGIKELEWADYHLPISLLNIPKK